ncbi:hypothetical protein [Microseira sp. BLCC-F43]|uniref:hypothetical protein n=1 Tax=Microseira sp. BLCC-F43 TaxID=3153602 RepID=UPI0035BA86DF
MVTTRKQHPEPCKSYFLMFLVDNRGNFGEGRLEWANLETWHSNQIIDLKPIEKFSEFIITNWIQEYR